jgi:RNA polymerase sigma-70 factor (ECF subfamily)
MLASHIRENGKLYHRMALSVVRSSEGAADACQQAFLNAWENRHEIRDTRSIRTYLTQVVIHESYVILRQSQRHKRRVVQKAEWPISSSLGHAERIEQRDLVIVALEKLPEFVRLIVTLRAMHGMSGNEVSDLLNLDAKDVSRKFRDGLDMLREFLTQDSTGKPHGSANRAG